MHKDSGIICVVKQNESNSGEGGGGGSSFYRSLANPFSTSFSYHPRLRQLLLDINVEFYVPKIETIILKSCLQLDL